MAIERNRTSRVLDREFDLIVVGGGIYGVCTAREAALQGLSVCLLEREDFGGKTTANSLKIIHGGLRYLQNLDFKRMRESIRERRSMHQLAPHLVRPMSFVIPCYGHLLRGREVMGGALAINEIISADRNAGVIRERRIPRGRLISKKQLNRLIPDLPEPGCVGGAVWYDGLALNTERLMLAFLEGAEIAGCQCLNYVGVEGFLKNSRGIVGVRAVDRLAGRPLEIRSKVVLNATGPWVDTLLGEVGANPIDRLFSPSKGMNLITRQIFGDHGAAIPYQESYKDEQAVFDKSKLHFFIIPWKQYSLIGSRHLPWSDNPDSFSIERVDVEQFLDEVNRAYPPARLQLSDVRRVHGGVLPALSRPDSEHVQITKHYTLRDHEVSDGIKGLVTLVGVKWTTARDVSERAIQLVMTKIGQESRVKTATMPLPSGQFGAWNALLADLESMASGRYRGELLERFAESHGRHSRGLLHQALEETSMGVVIEGEGASPTLAVEIDHAVRREHSHHLEDVILRRTELANGGHPGLPAIEQVAQLMGSSLGWSTTVRNEEIEATELALEEIAP